MNPDKIETGQTNLRYDFSVKQERNIKDGLQSFADVFRDVISKRFPIRKS